MNKKRIHGQIRITLQSDLCTSSGYAYAGIIDSDVCYDDYGFPFIPAKRLKGCFRETLESSLYAKYPDAAEELFGKAGEREAGDLHVGNAFPEDVESLRTFVAAAGREPERSRFYDTQQILSRYTHVVGQTKLQDGAAIDNSLRYTRVVNRKSPVTGLPMVFVAEVSLDEKNEALLKDVVCATRHIGLMRNRGFGNVFCEYQRTDMKAPEKKTCFYEETADGITTLSYLLENVSPLMLSGRTEDTSGGYIAGSNLLGILASRYLAREGNTAESEEFKDLFLNGKTIFTNIYPSDGERIYYPAPEYINRLKKTKKYVCNAAANPSEENSAKMANGNQAKKLKGKFVALSAEETGFPFQPVSVLEPQMDIVYHHSHYKKRADGTEGLLYGLEVLRSGQTFAGQIRVPDTLAGLVKELFMEEDLYFGKSKSVQYGRCVAKQPMKMTLPGKLEAKAGDRFLITFLSDGIFINENSAYTTDLREVAKCVLRDLNLPAKMEPADETDGNLSCLQTTLATGYSMVWNLRKDARPAIRAGSCIAVWLTEDCTVSAETFVGERCLEGYGQVRLVPADVLPFKLDAEAKATEHTETIAPNDTIRALMRDMIVSDWLEQRKETALASRRIPVSNSSLGRITMMLRETLAENYTTPEEELDEFAFRIDSIKSDRVKEEAKRLLRGIASDADAGQSGMDEPSEQEKKCKRNWKWKFGEEPQDDGAEKKELLRLGVEEQEISKLFHRQWGIYLMTVLVEMKYQGGNAA